MITKAQLDIPFKDFEPGADNPQTPREFTRESEREFDMPHADLDNMSEEAINKHLDFLDYLWTK